MQLQHSQAALRSPAGSSSKCKLVSRPNIVTSAAAVASPSVSVPPALAAAQQVVEQNGGWFAPTVTDQPEQLITQNVPFLTTKAGALPEMPRNLNHALYMYGR
jgi:hypothetical protein